MVKYHPMLFSTLMVQAINNNTKGETRRIMKIQPIDGCDKTDFLYEYSKYWQGDIIWVRETFAKIGDNYIYKADECIEHKDVKWKPSLFMPRDACRIYLEITDVRFERLNDISEVDAINEGIIPLLMSRQQKIEEGQLYMDYISKPTLLNEGLDPVNSYKSLWEKINGIGSWDGNPFVWVYNFKRIK